MMGLNSNPVLPDIDPYYIRAELCRRDFFAFVQTFWHVICKEKPVWGRHIQIICDELQVVGERVFRREPKEYDLIFNVPPGSTKSTLISQMFPAWCWARDDSLRFLTASYNDVVALEQAEYHRQIVRSDLYRKLFPHVQLHPTINAKSNFKTVAGGQRFSVGTGGGCTGIHGHFLIPDDPINPKEAASKAGLKAANDWLSRTFLSRKVDKAVTVMIMVMQRLDENDPTGVQMRTRAHEIRHICLPAELTEDVSPPELSRIYVDGLLDPIRLSRKILESEKLGLGSFGYSGQMLQRPVPDGGGILKREWFKVVSMTDVTGLVKRYMGSAPAWHIAADLAYTEKEINDPSAAMVYCRVGPFVVIRHARKFRLEQPDLERELPSYVMQHGYSRESLLAIEPKANGLSTIQNLRARTSLNVVASKAPSKDKVARVREYTALVEAGRVMLVDGDWVDGWLDEVINFPFAAHDEFPDCLSIAMQREMLSGLGADRIEPRNEFDSFNRPMSAQPSKEDVWNGIV